jgi:hypothetical protein
MPRHSDHNMTPVYDRNGEVYGWMCSRCGSGALLPEDAEEMHGSPCFQAQPAPWTSVALVALAVAVLIFAAVHGVTMYYN